MSEGVRRRVGFRHRAEAAALQALSFLAFFLPKRAGGAAGAGVGGLCWRLLRRRRRVALDNLAHALGGLPETERRRIARAAFRQFGRLLVEGLTLSRFSAADTGGLIQYVGLEHIRAAYAGGRGVILFSAHFGNWELVALMQGWMGLPLTLVTRPLDNPLLERRLAALRSMSGNEIVHKKNALRPMLGALKAGRGVAIVIDQNVRDGTAIFVDFFGRPAATTPSLALLALRTGAAVIPVFAFPSAGGGYDVEYLPEIVPRRSDDRDADLADLTQRCTSLIEQQVRRHPEAWLWMHERWKTRPRPAKPHPAPPRTGTPGSRPAEGP